MKTRGTWLLTSTTSGRQRTTLFLTSASACIAFTARDRASSTPTRRRAGREPLALPFTKLSSTGYLARLITPLGTHYH